MFPDIPVDEAVIISPNLGIPAFLDADAKVPGSKNVYQFTINIIAPRQFSAAQVGERLAGVITAVPLFEVELDTRRLRRGTPLSVQIGPVQETQCLILGTTSLGKLYENRQDRPSFLLRHEFFGKDRALFHAIASIDMDLAPPECAEWLRVHPFVMLDLVQVAPGGSPASTTPARTCYHALVLRNKDYTSFHVAQVSDLHVAQRYDEVLELLSGFLGPLGDALDVTRVVDFFKGKYRRRSAEKKVNEAIFQETEYSRFNPLNRRFQNPNNKFRQFIIWANQAAAHERLDLVLITGDILDYCLKVGVQKTDYSLPDTNWDIFLRIILNFPIEYRPGCEPTRIVDHEELAVPVFTIPGNHDMRVHGYPLTALGYYKYFGLTYLEAMLYKDPVKLPVEKALVIDKYCLKPYYQFINPFDDYYIRLGNRFFIMLNSGADSFLNLRSLLMGNPGCVGFKNTQMNFSRNVLATCAPPGTDGTTAFLVTHSPVLNPNLKGALRKSILAALGVRKYKLPEYFKAGNLKQHGRDDTNIAGDLDFDIGTTSKNRDAMLKLLFKHRLTTLCGHTHMLREFRFNFCGGESACASMDMNELVSKGMLEIWWDDYSDNESPAFMQENRPFMLQTPSVGIRKPGENREYGAFRMITLLGDQLDDIKIRHLSRLANEF